MCLHYHPHVRARLVHLSVRLPLIMLFVLDGKRHHQQNDEKNVCKFKITKISIALTYERSSRVSGKESRTKKLKIYCHSIFEGEHGAHSTFYMSSACLFI